MKLDKQLSPRVLELSTSDDNRVSYDSDMESQLKLYNVLSWIYACIFEIANAIKGLPLKAYRPTAQGLKEIPVPEIVNRPNKFQTRREFWEAHFSYLELTGNSYWEIVKNERGRPAELYLLPPNNITILKDPQFFIKGFQYEVNQKKIVFSPDEILFYRYFSPTSSYYGTSPIQSIQLASETDLYAQAFNRNFFKNDSTPSGIFKTEKTLGRQVYRRLKHQLITLRRGVKNAHKDILLEGGISYDKIQLSPKDMEFLRQREFSREEICAALGVPPAIVGIFRYANYANAEMQERIFYQKTILPKVSDFEEKLSIYISDLLQQEIILKHDFSNIDCLKPNFSEKTNDIRNLFKDGVITRNEARRLLNEELNVALSENTDGGDYFYLPMNLIPVGESRDKAKGFKTKALQLTFDEETEIWEKTIRKTTKFENELNDEVKKLFKKVERLIVKNISKLENKSKDVKELDLNWVQIFEGVEDFPDWYSEATKDIYLTLAETMGNDVLKDVAPHIEFNVSDPRVLEFIGDRMREYSKSINKKTIEDISRTLREGYEKGEGQEELKRRVREYFKQASVWRARTIARTEVNSSSNKARHLAVQQARDEGVNVNKKKWIHSRDDNVRESHRNVADIGWVALDYIFQVGDDSMEAPGQGVLPEENINCRCSLVYGVDED